MMKPATPRAAKAKPPTTKQLKPFGFNVLGPIAAGAYSTVVHARHKESGTEVAIKSFAKSPTGALAEDHARELQIMRFISETNHAHVCNLLAEYDDAAGGTHACLFYCKGGSLHHYLNKLRKKEMAMAEQLAAVCTAQMASALSFLHTMGIAHRDVKPANILYDGRRWRLCDFGFAVACAEAERLTQQCGSLAYCAPELLFGGQEGYRGRAVDMWALGCTVYEMRVGRVCFVGVDEEGVKLRIKRGFKGGTEYQPWLPHMDKEQRQLISALLSLDPAQRLSAEGVLRSAWIEERCAPTEEEQALSLGGPQEPMGAAASPMMDDEEGEEGEAAGEEMGAGLEAGEQDSDMGLGDLDIGQPRMILSWWCDVAGAGCRRPVEGSYDDEEHRCWAYNGEYMVCEVCYTRGAGVEHLDELVLVSGPPMLPVQ